MIQPLCCGRFRFAACALLFALLGAAPVGAQAPVVGVLAIGSAEQGLAIWDKGFAEGLRKLGYKVGQSLVIEYRFAHGDITRYPQLARELIERRAAVIVAPCGPSLRAIREINRTVPVIALCADEKNFLGEVASLARPGGYTTGSTFLSPESVGKRLELLKEIRPGLSRLGVLYQPDDPIDAHWRELERLQPVFGLVLQRLPVRRVEELEAAFEASVRERAHAVFVFPTNLMISQSARIAELARKHRMATVFEFPWHVEAGGLMSYGGDFYEFINTIAPTYVDKILKGVEPGKLPIVQPSRFELVVNLKTAQVIGVSIPASLLARAHRVIE